jgi:hypothetical protein
MIQDARSHEIKTYQLLIIYSIPLDDWLQICPEHVEVDWRNKLRINCASNWFYLHRSIEMDGQQNIKFVGLWTVTDSLAALMSASSRYSWYLRAEEGESTILQNFDTYLHISSPSYFRRHESPFLLAWHWSNLPTFFVNISHVFR